jgi:hypothetical protein
MDRKMGRVAEMRKASRSKAAHWFQSSLSTLHALIFRCTTNHCTLSCHYDGVSFSQQNPAALFKRKLNSMQGSS